MQAVFHDSSDTACQNVQSTGRGHRRRRGPRLLARYHSAAKVTVFRSGSRAASLSCAKTQAVSGDTPGEIVRQN